jgi:hypothetical protein
MTEDFVIEIMHKGEGLGFTARLLQQGYSHKFEVMVGDIPVYFEPDDAGSYRVVKMPWQNEKELLNIDKTLLAEISGKIEAILS